MTTTNKPRVTRTHLNGWKCEGLGVTGYGMTVACAYRSWDQRHAMQATPVALVRDHYEPHSVQSDLGTPFCYDPL